MKNEKHLSFGLRFVPCPPGSVERSGAIWKRSYSITHNYLLYYTFIFITILLLSGCRKEIEFENDFDESLYYLNGVIGVGESPEFTLGEVTSAADTFHIDFSCDAAISLISGESNTLYPIRTAKGICKYVNPDLAIAPLTTYTVKANIDDRVLTSEIETPQVYPYDFSLTDVKYLGQSSGSNFVNGEIIRYTANLYQVNFEALYSGERVPGPYVGVSLESGADTALVIDSDVIGRETMRPGTFKKIEELVIDERENRKLDVVMEIKVPERLDSVTLIPMVWSLDKHINQYILSYETHERSVSDPFAVPARMYSNIDGGVGIFGSYSRSADTFRVKLPE